MRIVYDEQLFKHQPTQPVWIKRDAANIRIWQADDGTVWLRADVDPGQLRDRWTAHILSVSDPVPEGGVYVGMWTEANRAYCVYLVSHDAGAHLHRDGDVRREPRKQPAAGGLGGE